MTAADEALAVAAEFIGAFNAQNARRLAATLNYPHIRLAEGNFVTVASSDEFVERSERGRQALEAERWHHTITRSIRVVQAGEDKVHLVLTNDRCHVDGTVYHSFDSLWIVTRLGGHWGIQFRSSFLHE